MVKGRRKSRWVWGNRKKKTKNRKNKKKEKGFFVVGFGFEEIKWRNGKEGSL